MLIKTKICSGCKQELDITNFNRHTLSKDGLNSQCRSCRTTKQKNRRQTLQGKAATLKYLYNVTIPQVEAQLKRQNNMCAICGDSFLTHKFAIDHCHTTGTFRGLLCRPCNSAIGLLKEDKRVLVQAIRYLKHDPSGLRRKTAGMENHS